MKKAYFIFIMLILAVGGVSAQNQESRKEHGEKMRKELDEFKMKFVAQEIELRDDQRKQFVELYSRMQQERGKLFAETRRLERQLKKNKNAGESEYASVSKAVTEAREKDARIEKKYDEQFAKFLTSKQIYKMKTAEEKFRKKIEEMRHCKKKGNPNNK